MIILKFLKNRCIRFYKMGCCASQPQGLLANPDNVKYIYEDNSAPRGIRNFLSSNYEKINYVIKLMVYDIDAHETELSFETEAIFSHPQDGTPDRVFYNEVRKISFVPIEGFNGSFVIFALDTKVGYRAFLFVQKKYKTIITEVIKQGK